VDAKTASGDPKPATDPNTKLLYGFIAAAFGIALLKGLSK
jgi:hypothetical protein